MPLNGSSCSGVVLLRTSTHRHHHAELELVIPGLHFDIGSAFLGKRRKLFNQTVLPLPIRAAGGGLVIVDANNGSGSNDVPLRIADLLRSGKMSSGVAAYFAPIPGSSMKFLIQVGGSTQ